MQDETLARTTSGYPMLVVLPITILTGVAGAALLGAIAAKIFAVIVAVLACVCLAGFYMVAPNEGRVLQLFGQYVGTDRALGLRWANPFYTKQRVSLRIRNFESGQLKVNDSAGNPIEIAAVVVWRVVDTAEAVFEVDDYEDYVAIQSEAAIRNMATSYPYDDHEGESITLRGSANEIGDILKAGTPLAVLREVLLLQGFDVSLCIGIRVLHDLLDQLLLLFLLQTFVLLTLVVSLSSINLQGICNSTFDKVGV